MRFLRTPSCALPSVVITAAALALSACGESGTVTDPTASSSRGGNGTAAGTAGTGSTSGATGTNTGTPSGATTNTVASRCNGTLAAITVDDVFVPTGASCLLNGTRVRGNVKVGFGGTLAASAARIDGNIEAADARRVSTAAGTVVIGNVQVKRRAESRLENTTIGGSVQVEEAGASIVATDIRVTGDVQVVKATSADLTRAVVNGDVQFSENTGALRSDAAVVDGNMQIEKNRGGVLLTANRVRQTLECKENVPAPTGTGNVAGEKKEQCRSL